MWMFEKARWIRRTIWPLLKLLGAAAVVVAFVATVFLYFFGRFAGRFLPQGSAVPKTELGIAAIVVGCTIAIYLVDVAQQLEDMKDTLKKRRPSKVLPLERAIADLFANLRRFAGNKPVKVDVIALHFESMRKQFLHHMEDADFKSLSLRVLTITSDNNSMGTNVPDDIRVASERMGAVLEGHKRKIRQAGSRLESRSKSMDVRFQHYASMPAILGIRITSPIRVCYLSFCRWEEPYATNYEIDDHAYHCVYEDAASAADADLVAVFDGTFQHHWREANAADVWTYPEPTAQASQSDATASQLVDGATPTPA